MKPSLMRQSTANLSRQKKESFKLKTESLLKLASLRIRKKKPWRKQDPEPQTAVGQRIVPIHARWESTGEKGSKEVIWRTGQKLPKLIKRESLHLRGSTNPTKTNWKRVTLRQCMSNCQKSEKQPEVTCHQELLNGTNSWFLLGNHRGQQTVGWCI